MRCEKRKGEKRIGSERGERLRVNEEFKWNRGKRMGKERGKVRKEYKVKMEKEEKHLEVGSDWGF